MSIFINPKKILVSSQRTSILLSLYSSTKNLNQLKEILNKEAAPILHTVKELELDNLIVKKDYKYLLTSTGYLFTLNLVNLIENCFSLKNSSNFWQTHNIENIPSKLLKKINLLKEANYISASEIDLSNTLKEYLKKVSKSKNLNIIMPIFSKYHFDVILDNLSNNKNQKNSCLNLIISAEILKSIKNHNYGSILLEFNKKKILKIWKTEEELPMFLTTADNFLSLNLFLEEGFYDDSTMLLDESVEGIEWGIEAFKYYQNKAELIDPLNYFN